MSTAWTAERLDALPEGTVIEWLVPDSWSLTYFTKESGGSPNYPWAYTRGGRESSESIILQMATGESIRVVSVLIDALLADETIRAGEDAFVEVTHLAGPIRNEAETVLRAAVAHITGGAK